MTLREFGNKIRETYTFCSNSICWITADCCEIQLWIAEPFFDKEKEEWVCLEPCPSLLATFTYNPANSDFVDLSEYGIVDDESDFSKCKEIIIKWNKYPDILPDKPGEYLCSFVVTYEDLISGKDSHWLIYLDTLIYATEECSKDFEKDVWKGAGFYYFLDPKIKNGKIKYINDFTAWADIES